MEFDERGMTVELSELCVRLSSALIPSGLLSPVTTAKGKEVTPPSPLGGTDRRSVSHRRPGLLVTDKQCDCPESPRPCYPLPIAYAATARRRHRHHCTVSQADEGAVRIPKDRPSYFDISKVPIDGQMSNAFNDNICFI